MGALLLGGVALLAVLLLLRGFVAADVSALMRSLRYTAAGVLLMAAIGLAVLDRVGLASLAGSMAWGLFTGGHFWPRRWPYWHGGTGGAAAGGASTAAGTEWLHMELDHDSGEMEGRVLKGTHSGQALATLSQSELLALYREIEALDPDSTRLLAAYMERRFGADWHASSGDTQNSSRTSGMSRAEALRVLALDEGANREDICAAHRRLMLNNHPDRGGSSYLAAKINEARDVLLRS
jgi:hypothetical protein